ncbi:MAG TPA: hypothetical protein VE954_20145 [Oligoflexus sp.]|uniref:low molecular weight protein tyrosine phosphatase family protein n=1 Tax=Oligoflexus sp. TaxID=1971216 RepID=UPI002D5FEE26|nr:hypothetical protein [Oligoflexus sp.]HYX35414.1 hypothetical protein [Oligoflexus sp.]
MKTQRIFFICSQNKLRSPTAEAIFSQHELLEVASAGLDKDAATTVTGELLEWADVIFVMEKNHLSRLRNRFGKYLKDKRIICLDIPDNYEYMDPVLIEILQRRIPKLLNLPVDS